MIASSASSSSWSGLSIAEAIGAPGAYKDSFTNGKGDVTVNIDACVELPGVQAIPAAEVTLCGFPQERIDRLAEYFLNGAPVFIEEDAETKEDIQERIAYYERQIEKTKKEHPDYEAQIIADLQSRLAECREQYLTAPEKRKRTPAALNLDEAADEPGICVVAELGKDKAAYFEAYTSEACGSRFNFINTGKGSYGSIIGEKAPEAAPRGMETSLNGAKAVVNGCLDSLGITDMRIESVSVVTYYSHKYLRGDREYEASADQCYKFSLVKTVMGTTAPAIKASTRLDTDDPAVPAAEEPEFNCTIGPEAIEILVDDTGIAEFMWANPSKVERILSEHVALMPFADVVRRAKDNIFYKNYTAYGSTAQINITSIRLSMMRIMQKDRPGRFLMVPVWDFMGYVEYSFSEGEQHTPEYYTSYVTINAIDGSNINRNWGY